MTPGLSNTQLRNCLHRVYTRPAADRVQIKWFKESYMLVMQLARGASTRSFSIRVAGVRGWRLIEEEDDRRVRTVTYTDWHRVERAMTLINLEVADLERQGWTITGESSRVDKPVT